MALHSLFALHVFDLDCPLPYTSHPPMVLLGIASMDKWKCQSVRIMLLEVLDACDWEDFTLRCGESKMGGKWGREERSEEEVAKTMAKTMAETMEEYITKTRAGYGLGVGPVRSCKPCKRVSCIE
ncbi:hypothetical protein Tco_0613232 [Tanacetum coccineum]